MIHAKVSSGKKVEKILKYFQKTLDTGNYLVYNGIVNRTNKKGAEKEEKNEVYG